MSWFIGPGKTWCTTGQEFLLNTSHLIYHLFFLQLSLEKWTLSKSAVFKWKLHGNSALKIIWPHCVKLPCGALNWSPSSLSCLSLFGYHKTILGERQKSSLLYSMVQGRNHRRNWWDSGLTWILRCIRGGREDFAQNTIGITSENFVVSPLMVVGHTHSDVRWIRLYFVFRI